MTNERLKVLLYNALVCLEEYGAEDLQTDLGITKEEYNEIMEG